MPPKSGWPCPDSASNANGEVQFGKSDMAEQKKKLERIIELLAANSTDDGKLSGEGHRED